MGKDRKRSKDVQEGARPAGEISRLWIIAVVLTTLLLVCLVIYTFMDVTSYTRTVSTPEVVTELFDLVFSNWEYDRNQLADFMSENFAVEDATGYSMAARDFLSVRQDGVLYGEPPYRVVLQKDGCTIIELIAQDASITLPKLMLVYSLDSSGHITDYSFGTLVDVEQEAGAAASAMLG